MEMPWRVCLLVVAAVLGSCRNTAAPDAIDRQLAARVPVSAVALAGVDLDRLRASPVYPKLPPAVHAFLAPFADSHQALIASDGRALLVIARGDVPGGTRMSGGISLFGAPDLITAAQSAHAPAAVLAPAARVASGQTLWIAIRGGVRLPLAGDVENLNNLLRGVEWLTVTLEPSDPATIEVKAECPSPGAAIHWEQTVRALVSMTAATTGDAQVAVAFKGMRLDRTERSVRAAVTLPLGVLVGLGR